MYKQHTKSDLSSVSTKKRVGSGEASRAGDWPAGFYSTDRGAGGRQQSLVVVDLLVQPLYLSSQVLRFRLPAPAGLQSTVHRQSPHKAGGTTGTPANGPVDHAKRSSLRCATVATNVHDVDYFRNWLGKV